MAEGVSQELGRICRDIPSGTLLEWECCIAKHFLAIIDEGHTFRSLQCQVKV